MDTVEVFCFVTHEFVKSGIDSKFIHYQRARLKCVYFLVWID